MSWFSRLVNAFRGSRLGNEWQVRETSRDVKLLPWLDAVVRDVRYGFRMLCKSPVVTTAAVLSLALAIGACTAAYTLIDALILRPLPVRDPKTLVYLTYPANRPGEAEAPCFRWSRSWEQNAAKEAARL